MNETPFFFDQAGTSLFGVWHEPAGEARRTPFVFCHPFGEEKLWAHRPYVTFARELAQRGHAVLRFDYRGNGDSGGRFSESSLSTAIADIGTAIDVTRARTGAAQVGLVGLRLGASLAFKVAAARTDVGPLVLWAPIVNGERYLQELLRINLTTQMAVYREIRDDREALGRVLAAGGTVNVDGYEMTRGMSDGLTALSLLSDAAVPSVPTYLAQLERNEAAKPPAEITDLAARITGCTLQVVREDPFWKEIPRFYDRAPNLFTATLSWLEDRAGSADTR